jgi:hypothetical protein
MSGQIDGARRYMEGRNAGLERRPNRMRRNGKRKDEKGSRPGPNTDNHTISPVMNHRCGKVMGLRITLVAHELGQVGGEEDGRL